MSPVLRTTTLLPARSLRVRALLGTMFQSAPPLAAVTPSLSPTADYHLCAFSSFPTRRTTEKVNTTTYNYHPNQHSGQPHNYKCKYGTAAYARLQQPDALDPVGVTERSKEEEGKNQVENFKTRSSEEYKRDRSEERSITNYGSARRTRQYR
jgi:hypothetical protein